jgi:hypothetical protein
MAVPVLAGTIFQFRGWRRLVEFLVTVVLLCAALNGPLYLYDPAHFPTAHIANKIANIPPAFHASLVLPAIGALVGSCSFFVRMDRARIFGLMALSLVPVLYIVLIYWLLTYLHQGVWSSEYALPISIFGGIWVSARLAATSADGSATAGEPRPPLLDTRQSRCGEIHPAGRPP